MAYAAGTLFAAQHGLDWFRQFCDERLLEGLGHRLVLADRERCGRQASPSATFIDSQTPRICKSNGPRGYDSAKRIVGRERHAMVDTHVRVSFLPDDGTVIDTMAIWFEHYNTVHPHKALGTLSLREFIASQQSV